MDTIDKIRKARILIQSENPFFAYLSLYLKFKEDKGELPPWGGMGVNARGDCTYKKEFVDNLTDEELRGVIVHEILHLSFLHLMRLGQRQHEYWNIACDIVVNYILKQNGFSLPDGCLIAGYNNSITIFGQEIKDIDKKTPEMIYDEFKIKTGSGRGKGKGKGGKDGKDGNEGGGFDYHDYEDGESELTEDEKRELEKEWKDRVTEAYTTAKLAGKVPGGIERLLDKLHKNEINWRTILLKEVQNVLPYDYTYSRPFKSSFSTGYYMPDVSREMINVVVGIDVSGSIDKKTYTDFASEIIGMARAFRNRINIRFLTHDVIVQNDYVVENGNIDKIKSLKIDGGGGTSHKPIMDYIDKNVRNARLAIFLTDGYSDIDSINLDDYRFKKMFVIQNGGTDESIKDKVRNKVLRLKGEYDE